jgi:hypothetical protein
VLEQKEGIVFSDRAEKKTVKREQCTVNREQRTVYGEN